MKKKILITSRHFQEVLSDFKESLHNRNIQYDIIKSKQVVSKNQILKVIHKYDGLICSDDVIDKEVLERAKKLKVISKWGVGINSIDYKYARSKKIKVKNCKNIFTESTSNYVIGMILNITRKIHLADKDIKNNIWNRYEGMELKGKTIGIIGCGNIGSEIVRKLHTFDLNIFLNNIKKININFLKKYNAKQVDLLKICKVSDIISVNTDLNNTSFNLINKNHFKLMKSKAIIINCARGGIVNEEDLFKALDNKKIMAAGIDCFQDEPPKKSLNLNKYKNCIFSSHNAFNTNEAVKKTHQRVFKNLVSNL